MNRIEVIVVTGMSGAGKTQTMAIFENMGYQCIDNYPVNLLKEFGELLRTSNTYNKVAMAVSLTDAIFAIRILSNMEWIDLNTVFLDCEDKTILTRYKQTRRSHPLMIKNITSSLVDSIDVERRQAEPIAKLANIIIDTTLLKPVKLQDKIEANFLPNPFYVESLRSLTGNDKEVYDYVMSKKETKEFVERTIAYYDYLIKEYEKEGKMSLIIGVGCTGGQHRSVTLANYLAKHYGQIYQVYTWHRDADH